MKVVWSPLALKRVGEIGTYIAEDNLGSARKWVTSIFKQVQRLRKFPESGRWVIEVNRSDIREIIHGAYRIIYRLEKQRISIPTVRHAKQLLPIGEIIRSHPIELPDNPA